MVSQHRFVRQAIVNIKPIIDILESLLLSIPLLEVSYVLLDHYELEQTQLGLFLNLELKLMLHLTHHLIMCIDLIPFI